MRNDFFDILMRSMEKDPSLFLLVADMGRGLVEKFAERFPDRFVNVGICEQNMIGVAAGLCNAGFRPFCYTISNFAVHRCLEQIRNDICLHNYPVTIVGTSTGYDNGLLGPTHQVIDDFGCIKPFPNMRVYSPASRQVIAPTVADVLGGASPAYIRIGKAGAELKDSPEALNFMVRDRDGAKTLVITHGGTLMACMEAAVEDDTFSIFCVNCIHPLKPSEFKPLFERFDHILVVEDHFPSSGLYGSLCRLHSEFQPSGARLHALGPMELYEDIVGTDRFFADRYGYTAEKLVERIALLNT